MKKIIVVLLTGMCLSGALLLAMDRPAKLCKTVPASSQEALDENLFEVIDNNDFTPFLAWQALNNRLFEAIKNNNTQEALQLINDGAEITVKDEDGRYPLEIAEQKNNQIIIDALETKLDTLFEEHIFKPEPDVEIIKELLAAGANLNLYSANNYPLLFGIKNPEIIAELIKYGADVNEGLPADTTRPQLPEGWTLLHAISFLYSNADSDEEARRYIAIAKTLLKGGAQVDERNKAGETPLHTAVNFQNDELIQILLLAGAQIDAQDDGGQTPLHLAIYQDDNRILKLLLAANANPNSKDKDGDTPLHFEARHYEIGGENTALLLDAGADPSIVNKKNKTPLGKALEYVYDDTSRDITPEVFELNKLAKIRTLVTAVTPTEVQHIIPTMIVLKYKMPVESNIFVYKDLRQYLKNTFIQQLVNDKLQYAKLYLPNDSDELLKPLILRNIIAALKRSPSINSVATPEAADREPMDLSE